MNQYSALKPVIAFISLAVTGVFLASCANSTSPEPTPINEPYSGDQLVPLHSGNRWEYLDSGETSPYWTFFKLDSLYAPQERPTFSDLLFTSRRYFGKCVWYSDVPDSLQDPWNDVYPHYALTSEGIACSALAGDTMDILTTLARDVAIGDSVGGNGWVCVAIETVETPAGTFEECYHMLEKTGYSEARYWFKRGVGMVRMEVRDPTGTIIKSSSELVSYELK